MEINNRGKVIVNHLLTMKDKIIINYIGRLQDNKNESTRMHNNRRISNVFEFSNEGNGVLDLYTEDASVLLAIPEDNIYWKSKTNNKRALWITEVRPFREELYTMIEKNIKGFMKHMRLDYIFSMDKEFCDKDPRFIHLLGNGSLVKKPCIYKKTKLCSMITSSKILCPMHKERLLYAKKFQGKVDLFGRGINEIKEKEEGLARFMFSIAIENCKRDLTFTEKLLDCFLTGAIPIYLGAKNIETVFDKRGIIFLDEDFEPSNLSRELYVSMLPYAIKNFFIANALLTPIEDALLKVVNAPTNYNETIGIKTLIENYLQEE